MSYIPSHPSYPLFSCFQSKVPSRLGSNVEDEHMMVVPDNYTGKPGSGAPGAQPFRVIVAPKAAIMMDFHAHLNMNEVIGVLGGSWDPETKVLK